MGKKQREQYQRAQDLANKIAPERTDPLAFWCLVEAILAVNK